MAERRQLRSHKTMICWLRKMQRRVPVIQSGIMQQ
jgi:hypothetical protein